jgi:tetratricopeptide (TPR) repeat protein
MSKKQLTPEIKKTIRDLVSSMKTHNFYTILGVPVDASRDDIRRSYFSLSKEYHPDAYYGEDLGEYKVHLELVFRSISRAYDVLSVDAKRSRYDVYLKQKNDLRGIESTISKDMNEVKESVRQQMGVTPIMAAFGQAQRTTYRTPSPSSAPAPRPSKQPVRTFDRSILESSATRHEEYRKRRLKSLLNIQAVRVEEKKVSPETGKKIKELLASAEAAEKENNHLGAMSALKLAITLDPGNTDLQERFNSIVSRTAPFLGNRYFIVGTHEEEFGDLNAALESYQRAVEFVPDNPEYISRLAQILLSTGGDLHRAHDLARRAVVLDANNASHHLLMARICLKAGLLKSAVASLKACLKLDEGNEEARELLRQV